MDHLLPLFRADRTLRQIDLLLEIDKAGRLVCQWRGRVAWSTGSLIQLPERGSVAWCQIGTF